MPLAIQHFEDDDICYQAAKNLHTDRAGDSHTNIEGSPDKTPQEEKKITHQAIHR